MNFSKGILETRLVTYKHLKNVLRSIPLDTPTTIELRPGYELRVTLLDANHCPGAVMFLIEGQGKAVLYTGDIRSEPWWVNALVRHPCMTAYASSIRTLDAIYLDTTFATKIEPYRDFPSKADGLRELLTAVDKYPKNTVFHFNSWTFGYEEVWVALCALLQTRMHIDGYKLRLFRAFTSPKNGNTIPEAAALCGFKLGNAWHDGCLTDDSKGRLHGCEPGHGCNVKNHPNTVRIVPIISRLATGEEIPELGAGGGHGDLAQWHELDLSDHSAAMSLLSLCSSIKDEADRKRAINLVMEAIQSRNRKLSLPHADALDAEDEITLETLTKILAHSQSSGLITEPIPQSIGLGANPTALPKEIRFPYSRHSSYNELRHLVSAFAPRDLVPCTVDEASWDPSLGMQSLFGDLCSADLFVHDKEMLSLFEARLERERDQPNEDEDQQTQSSAAAQSSQVNSTSQSTQQEQQPNGAPNEGSEPTQAVYQSALQSHSRAGSQPQSGSKRVCSQTPQKRKRSPDRASSASNAVAQQVTEPALEVSSSSPAAPTRPGPWSSEEQNAMPASRPSVATTIKPTSEGSDFQNTQVSLPDEAFDSQQSAQSEETRRRKVERRKEAYRAAKGNGNGDDGEGEMGWDEYSMIAPEKDFDFG